MVRITTTALDMAFCGEAYSISLAATIWPNRKYAWWINQETPLPHGLSLSKEGVISGIPLYPQKTSVQIYVTASEPEETDWRIWDLNVYQQLQIQMPSSLELHIQQPEEIQLIAVGGVPPYTWSCDSLLFGLRLEGSRISGQPRVSGGVSPTRVNVKDSIGKTASQQLFIRVV